MENRNVLLVIASISFFLVIVVGVGLWLFWPRDAREGGEAAAAADTLFDRDFDSFEFYRGRDELPGLMDEEEQAPGEAPAAEGAEEPGAQAEEGAAEGAPEASGAAAGEERGEERDVVFGEAEDPGEERVTIAPRESKDFTPPPKQTVTSAPEQKAPAARPEPAGPTESAARSETTPSKPASKPAPPKESPPKRVTLKEYEIQVGSFRTRSAAEAANDKLKALGFPGLIRTRDIGGATYFRVRLGPYAEKAEAEKFLSWIREVQGFEESYISQVTRVVTMN